MRNERLKRLKHEWDDSVEKLSFKEILNRDDVEAYNQHFERTKQKFGELFDFWEDVTFYCMIRPSMEAREAFFNQEIARVYAEGVSYLIEAGDEHELLYLHFNIARHHRSYLRFDQSLFHLEEGLSLYQRLGIELPKWHRTDAAEVYFHCAQYDKVVPHCDELITLLAQKNHPRDVEECLLYEGMRARALGLGLIKAAPLDCSQANPGDTPDEPQLAEDPHTKLPDEQSKLEKLLKSVRPKTQKTNKTGASK